MTKFYIDKQQKGWRWYAYGDQNPHAPPTEERGGFKTQKAAKEDARAHFTAYA